ncbi:hypothetical protein [Acrocarpospora catenulata]|uniref:hypothetical protein n=1 Tax=Acrocarpospora catenulata TaxID=2836182 RepID=UPI001BD93744|nr:hypothetical protein [Acrocarpospora catenulata]
MTVEEALSSFLREAGEGLSSIFAASCVERTAGMFFLARTLDDRNAGDEDTFLNLLEDLWRGVSLSSAERSARRERVLAFPELQGGEEPSGVQAFAYDAISAMYYSYAYLTSGDSAHIIYCSSRTLNSASFVDDVAVSDSRHYAAETMAQLADIEILANSAGRIDVDLIRDRSRTIGRNRVEALNSVFP